MRRAISATPSLQSGRARREPGFIEPPVTLLVQRRADAAEPGVSAAGSPRVIVTRPAVQAAAAVRRLEARGIAAVALPLIEIAGVADTTPLAAAWQRLATHRLVVFVSSNAVLHFFAASPQPVSWPRNVLAAAPGPGTAAALRSAGVDPAAIIEPAEDAEQLDSEALWQRLGTHDWRGAHVLFVRGDGGRDWLAGTLVAAGASVDAVTAYVRRAPALDAAARSLVDAATAAPQRHLWLFSSSQAIEHLETLAGRGRWSESRAIATHPRIAARARQAGFATVQEARPGLDDVIACIQSS